MEKRERKEGKIEAPTQSYADVNDEVGSAPNNEAH